MSQRSHIASSGRTAICECSAACSEPSSSVQREVLGEHVAAQLVPERLRLERRLRQVERLQVDHLVVARA